MMIKRKTRLIALSFVMTTGSAFALPEPAHLQPNVQSQVLQQLSDINTNLGTLNTRLTKVNQAQKQANTLHIQSFDSLTSFPNWNAVLNGFQDYRRSRFLSSGMGSRFSTTLNRLNYTAPSGQRLRHTALSLIQSAHSDMTQARGNIMLLAGSLSAFTSPKYLKGMVYSASPVQAQRASNLLLLADTKFLSSVAAEQQVTQKLLLAIALENLPKAKQKQ